MTLTLSFHRQAQAEATAAFQSYAGEAAEGFQKKFTDLLRLIQQYPEAFPAYGDGFRKAVMPRKKYPYTIFYRLTPRRIRIVAVAYQKRKPDYWKHRR